MGLHNGNMCACIALSDFGPKWSDNRTWAGLCEEWDWRRVTHCSSTLPCELGNPRDKRRGERPSPLLCGLVNWVRDVEKLNGPSLAKLTWVCLRTKALHQTSVSS